MNKETIKQFLKPDWRKIILFLIFMIVSVYFCAPCPKLENSSIVLINPGAPLCEEHGFPLGYFQRGHSYLEGWYQRIIWVPRDALFSLMSRNRPFYFAKFTVDLILWYFISCLIIFVFDKFRTKKQ